MDDELRDRVKRLTDRAEVYDCVQRYARGIDRQDRALLRSAYHDGAIDDHVGFVGEIVDFIDWALAYHTSQTRYQHYLLNHTADIDGDEAHAEIHRDRPRTGKPHDGLRRRAWPPNIIDQISAQP